jgi:copper chaperone
MVIEETPVALRFARSAYFTIALRGAQIATFDGGRHAALQLPLRRIIELKRGESLAEFTLRIDGMHCGACIRRVNQALASAQGIEVEEVRIGAARLRSIEDPLPVQRALAAVEKAGYAARLET